MSARKGVLLVNIGTPESATVSDVRRYLSEFLSDPRVLTMAAPLRWLLLRCFILPFRSPKSARAYQSIWTAEGSPLMVISKRQQALLQARLGPSYQVELAMRYGSPNLKLALDRLVDQGVEDVTVIPLYPQYSMAATASSLTAVTETLSARQVIPKLRIVSDFFDHPKFIAALHDIAAPRLLEFQPDLTLMSYHGLPENHMIAIGDAARRCLRDVNCCESIRVDNRWCYRAQAFATSRALAKSLGIQDYQVSFQSRLGRTPWIRPFTDEELPRLAARGVKRLAVLCPSFVADCLETIEEIGIRARRQWQDLGGEDLLLLPCVNEHPTWIDCLAELVACTN